MYTYVYMQEEDEGLDEDYLGSLNTLNPTIWGPDSGGLEVVDGYSDLRTHPSYRHNSDGGPLVPESHGT